VEGHISLVATDLILLFLGVRRLPHSDKSVALCLELKCAWCAGCRNDIPCFQGGDGIGRGAQYADLVAGEVSAVATSALWWLKEEGEMGLIEGETHFP